MDTPVFHSSVDGHLRFLPSGVVTNKVSTNVHFEIFLNI